MNPARFMIRDLVEYNARFPRRQPAGTGCWAFLKDAVIGPRKGRLWSDEETRELAYLMTVKTPRKVMSYRLRRPMNAIGRKITAIRKGKHNVR